MTVISGSTVARLGGLVAEEFMAVVRGANQSSHRSRGRCADVLSHSESCANPRKGQFKVRSHENAKREPWSSRQDPTAQSVIKRLFIQNPCSHNNSMPKKLSRKAKKRLASLYRRPSPRPSHLAPIAHALAISFCEAFSKTQVHDKNDR